MGQWPTFADNGVAKIYWIPLDPAIASAEMLSVTVEPLNTLGPSLTMTDGSDLGTAWGWGGAFWPSGTRFPGPGRYRLTASAPGHRGCFELTV